MDDDEEVAAIVLDNASGFDKSGFSAKYAKVESNGIVTDIQSCFSPPSPEWKPCKDNTKIGSPY
ncbi:hypothetical protein [Collimonas sp.]|uniref:hypothetical protein n=1 Tax=Collimonas sp. TaxID=1963772 RepID=UPI002B6A0BB5|nr:hypothetical protein [Collimonas sp.]HWX03200.1 hypothetical protein [Collimonas sp.]